MRTLANAVRHAGNANKNESQPQAAISRNETKPSAINPNVVKEANGAEAANGVGAVAIGAAGVVAGGIAKSGGRNVGGAKNGNPAKIKVASATKIKIGVTIVIETGIADASASRSVRRRPIEHHRRNELRRKSEWRNRNGRWCQAMTTSRRLDRKPRALNRPKRQPPSAFGKRFSVLRRNQRRYL